MKPLSRKSIKDVTQRKLRSVLTVLGIAVGVLGLTAITITQGQLSSAIKYSEDKTGIPEITYFTQPTRAHVVEAMRTVPNVKVAEDAGVVYTQWKVASGHKALQLAGMADLRHHRINRFELTSGSWPKPGQILMESSNSALASVKAGDRVTIQAAGSARTLTVSGLVRSRGRPSSSFVGMGLAYMGLRDLQQMFHSPGHNFFMVQLKDYGLRDSTAKALQRVLGDNHVTVLQAVVGRDATLRTVMGGILSLMQVLSLVALLLSIFLLLSTISTLVTEQIRIIGTMKAIGATRTAVMRNYLGSVALYGIAGTVVGFLLGVAGAMLLMTFISTMFTLDTGAFTVGVVPIVLALCVGIGLPLAAAVLPIWFGTRITVHQALAGYGLDSSQKRSRLARMLARVLTFVPGLLRVGPQGVRHHRTRSLLGFVPGTMQLGIRNLFRKRTRAFLTLLALSVSAVAFMSVQTTAYSFSTWLNHLMDTYAFDVQVNFPQPQRYAAALPAASGLGGVTGVEPMAYAQVTTDWGSAMVSGVLPSTTLYQKQIVEGRWFTPADRNVVLISTQSRDVSHLRVGDVITVWDKLHRAHYKVIGVVVDNNGILTKFGQIVAPMSQVNAFRGLPASLTDGLMIGTTSKDTAAVAALSRKIDDRLAAAGIQATVMTQTEIKDRITGQVNILNVMLYAVVVVVALVGTIGLFNSLAMSVLERRREIGILRSMGATGRKVAGVFWTEGLTLGIIAWLAGVLLGIPAAYGFVALIGKLLMPVPFSMDPMGVVFMLAFILVVGTLASIVPVWGAARVRIATTLRYDG